MEGITAVRRLSVLALCASVLVAPLLATAAPAAAVASGSCSEFSYDLTQLVNPKTDASLLSRWTGEGAEADTFGFTENDGVVAEVAASKGTDLTAIWRLYKAGDFVWATEGADVDSFVAAGYTRQFVDFYAAGTGADCLAPLYRFKRDGVHRMATESAGVALVKDGWTREAVGFYVVDPNAGQAPAPQPATDLSTDTKFSIAVLPDTQNEVVNPADTRFKNRATWLANNKSSLDLRFALQVGDLVNWGAVVPSQFTKASTDIAPLEAAMPWVGAIGNHDTAAVCVGGSACPGANTSQTVRDTSAYNQAFPVSRFKNVGGTFEPNKVDNSYQRFSAGGVDWLVLDLELWPRAAAVEWAKTVVASHPKDNVVVLTHAYLEGDGSISQSNGGYGSTSPQYLFDHLIKVYPNIKMVFSGHVGDSAVRTDTGVNGNKILSVLQCYHSSTNPVRIVKIDTAAGSVTSSVYAPQLDLDYPSASTSTTGLNFVR
jgi:hypothetical protein